MRSQFEKVSITSRAVTPNGKKKQKTFYQTINPWNVNAEGRPKTRGEILDELAIESAEWVANIRTGKIA